MRTKKTAQNEQKSTATDEHSTESENVKNEPLMTLTIDQQMFGLNVMPGWNDFIHAYARSPVIGNRMKRDCMMACTMYIRRQLKGRHIDGPVIVHYHFYEATLKRDLDNILFISKPLLDALQACGILPQDNWHYIRGITADRHLDRKHPKIVVEFEEVKE